MRHLSLMRKFESWIIGERNIFLTHFIIIGIRTYVIDILQTFTISQVFVDMRRRTYSMWR